MSDYAARFLAPGLALRPRTDADLAFLAELYAATREEELRPVEWSSEQKLAFLRDQFEKQHAHYLLHYPTAEWFVIEHEGIPIGRFYVARTEGEIRLMDVSLLAEWRGRGTGTALMRALTERADSLGLMLGLHVEPYNPALRLYQRFGFTTVETRGVYLFMQRQVGATGSPS
jgi:GNAT superfamily N-acetyltransferase